MNHLLILIVLRTKSNIDAITEMINRDFFYRLVLNIKPGFQHIIKCKTN